MSLIKTTGRLRYIAPLLLIVAVAACSKKEDPAAPAAGRVRRGPGHERRCPA